MTEPKDHNPELFSFEYEGKTYTFEKSLSILNKPGFIRKNRRRDEIDILFTLLEEVAGEDSLEVIDEMEPEEFEDFAENLNTHIEQVQGATLGK